MLAVSRRIEVILLAKSNNATPIRDGITNYVFVLFFNQLLNRLLVARGEFHHINA